MSEKGKGKASLARNRRAFHEYLVEERIECGIELRGTEVKSMRSRHFSFSDSYARVRNGQLYLIGLHINEYTHGNIYNHDPDRDRKLLVHRAEIDKLRRRVDEKGFIYVVDRKKDMIITGGENVYPAEVENVLYKHPGISQAAVIGTPDRKWGEIVTAMVVKKNGSEIPEEDIKLFCRGEIAGYKVPKKVLFVDVLPMSASGKILKYKLRKDLDTQTGLLP